MHNLVFVRKEIQLSAELSVCKKGTAAECTVRLEGQICNSVHRSELLFCKKLNKAQFVDVAPTLGVNQVISCVMISLLGFL